MIKLIVSDLDGTLFNSKHALDQRSADVIHKAQGAGIEFMVATGRAKENVLPYFEEFDIKCSKILLNGAMYLNAKDQVERSIPMIHDDVCMIMNLLHEQDVIGQIFYKGGIACTNPQRLHQEFKKRMKMREHVSDEVIEDMLQEHGFCHYDLIIDDINKFLQENPDVYKIEAFANDEKAIATIREKLKSVLHLAISNSIADNIEITAIQAQKGWMLERICEQRGFRKEEVVTIGDSMNDYSMIHNFPNSYAMANACPQILQAAAHHTLTNHEGGVVSVIEKILEEQGGC